jgi:hypothetical protein
LHTPLVSTLLLSAILFTPKNSQKNIEPKCIAHAIRKIFQIQITTANDHPRIQYKKSTSIHLRRGAARQKKFWKIKTKWHTKK